LPETMVKMAGDRPENRARWIARIGQQLLQVARFDRGRKVRE
jgi:hypothetical protein